MRPSNLIQKHPYKYTTQHRTRIFSQLFPVSQAPSKLSFWHFLEVTPIRNCIRNCSSQRAWKVKLSYYPLAGVGCPRHTLTNRYMNPILYMNPIVCIVSFIVLAAISDALCVPCWTVSSRNCGSSMYWWNFSLGTRSSSMITSETCAFKSL